MLTLKLYPTEFLALMAYLRETANFHRPIMSSHQTLAGSVLIHYLDRLKSNQMLTWQVRRKDKEYRFNLPLPVAKAIHQEMQHSTLTGWELLVLGKIDQALINLDNRFNKPSLLDAHPLTVQPFLS